MDSGQLWSIQIEVLPRLYLFSRTNPNRPGDLKEGYNIPIYDHDAHQKEPVVILKTPQSSDLPA